MSDREVRRYSFKASVPPEEIENTLFLAVLAAEGLHGQSRVRLDATYYFDAEKHACVIDSGSDVGRDICRMFTGFAIRQFGDTAFTVCHREGAARSRAAPTGNEIAPRPDERPDSSGDHGQPLPTRISKPLHAGPPPAWGDPMIDENAIAGPSDF